MPAFQDFLGTLAGRQPSSSSHAADSPAATATITGATAPVASIRLLKLKPKDVA